VSVASFASGAGATVCYDRVVTNIRLANKPGPGSRQGKELVLTSFGGKRERN
jgi:hypothetical protein